MQDFRNLKVWERSHQLVLKVYRATQAFPAEEMYGMRSQIRRAAASIPANLAEGCGRGTDADFARFVQHAMGSASELEYHLLLAQDLQMIPPDWAQSAICEAAVVKRMLVSLLQTLKGRK
jgi:four helix bundle protein